MKYDRSFFLSGDNTTDRANLSSMERHTAEGTLPARRRRADGERSRETILQAAAELATIEGLEGLSIGGLAERIGMSKSGLYAHFGSKEELQLATVDKAGEIFVADVIQPGLAAPAGLERLYALCDRFLSHVERQVLPGGCFFASAAAELDTRPGPVKERVADFQRGWAAMFEREVREAQASGDLDPGADPAQVAFELNAYLLLANSHYLLQSDRSVFGRARTAIRERLQYRG
jgi:AcrR family transcriptional regulator